ncbi:jg14146, partial [Pararge aegeria aegeria]
RHFELAKKSQARHQRVQSMSAGVSKPSPIQSHRPPLSAKLPRKAQGYNSEGYFSSDQEDSGVSGSVRLRSSPLAQNVDRSTFISPIVSRQIKSPVTDMLQPKRTSKSPIVDSIMSRSDYTPRQALNLPLKSSNSSYIQNVHRTASYGNLNCHKHVMADIIDQSPEGVMLTDISSPELDILTPDNGLSTPEHSKSPLRKSRVPETPDLLFKKCPLKSEHLYIDDEDNDSNPSSTGTYTIEGDNYTEEQKARMSIDKALGVDLCNESIDDMLKKRCSVEKEPEVIFEYPNPQRVITKEPRRDICLRNPLSTKTAELQKVSKDKNVLEISCCYESPNESDLAMQTTKQIKINKKLFREN